MSRNSFSIFLISIIALAGLNAGAAIPAEVNAPSGGRSAARVYATLNPGDGSMINNAKPAITAEYLDEGIGVNPAESKLFVDGADVTSGAALSANKITYTPPAPLADGTHKVKLDVVDRAGNATSVAWSFTVHTRPPAIRITSHTQNQFVNQGHITVSGTVDNPRARVVVNGIGAVSERGAFTARVNLIEGGNTLTAVATDSFGNSGSDTVVVVVDTKPPVIEIAAPTASSLLNTRTATVSGMVDKKAATVTVSAGKGAAVPAELGSGSFTVKDVALAEGVNIITARAVSQAGNTGTATVKVTVDSVPPRVAITAPKDQSVTNRKTIPVSGTADDPLASVKVNGTPVQIIRGGFTLASVSLNEGSNAITVTATDRAGNQAKASVVTVMLDTTPPPSPTISPLPPVTRSAAIAVSGTAEPGAQAEIFVNGASKGRVKADDKGAFRQSLNLTEGNNAVTAVAYDAIGNASPPSAAVNVFLDTKPPKIL